jgi:hypothetical protein
MDQAARLRIESCIVSNMSSAGILHGAANGEMMVLDTIVRDNAGHGIAVFSADVSIVVDHVRSEHNSSDGILFPAPGSTKAPAAIVFGYDNGGAMYARGAGAIVTANANTATLVAGFDLECFQNALIITSATMPYRT